MKNLSVLIFVAVSFFVIQMLSAQNPAISTAHSDAEIVRMIEQFRAANSRDVVPSNNLQKHFRTHFPNARRVEWERAAGIYEAEFKIGRRDFKAFYDSNGNLLMIVEEIHRSALPAVVRNAAEARHPKSRIDDVYKIRRGTETLYRVKMDRRGTEVKLLISSGGAILNERID